MMLSIELVYCPMGQDMVQRRVPWGDQMTVADAVQQSGLSDTYPEIMTGSVGIYARIVSWDTPVKPGDRIECYRPLLIDPKEKRRKRAKQ